MGLYKAQFISMIIMTALGIGVFVGFNMEWVSLDTNTTDFFKETGFADVYKRQPLLRADSCRFFLLFPKASS